MPVDAANLNAVVSLRREVPAVSADRHRREDRQADEDVCAMQAREGEEDRPERLVVRGEADSRILEQLRQQERQPHQERQRQASLETYAVAALDRLERPVHREARG